MHGHGADRFGPDVRVATQTVRQEEGRVQWARRDHQRREQADERAEDGKVAQAHAEEIGGQHPAKRYRRDEEHADESTEPLGRHAGVEHGAERGRRHRAQREPDDDGTIDVAPAPPDTREISDQHRHRQHRHRRADTERPRDEREHDDPGAEPRDAADDRGHERPDDQDSPAERIGHVVSSYAPCLAGSRPLARSSCRSTP